MSLNQAPANITTQALWDENTRLQLEISKHALIVQTYQRKFCELNEAFERIDATIALRALQGIVKREVEQVDIFTEVLSKFAVSKLLIRPSKVRQAIAQLRAATQKLKEVTNGKSQFEAAIGSKDSGANGAGR